VADSLTAFERLQPKFAGWGSARWQHVTGIAWSL